jgi:hypothetical protein
MDHKVCAAAILSRVPTFARALAQLETFGE